MNLLGFVPERFLQIVPEEFWVHFAAAIRSGSFDVCDMLVPEGERDDHLRAVASYFRALRLVWVWSTLPILEGKRKPIFTGHGYFSSLCQPFADIVTYTNEFDPDFASFLNLDLVRKHPEDPKKWYKLKFMNKKSQRYLRSDLKTEIIDACMATVGLEEKSDNSDSDFDAPHLQSQSRFMLNFVCLSQIYHFFQ